MGCHLNLVVTPRAYMAAVNASNSLLVRQNSSFPVCL